MMILKYGSKGDDVRHLQTLLSNKGFKGKNDQALIIDGYFGDNTEFAVLNFQRHASLVVDGLVGTKTMQALTEDYSNSDKFLKDEDYQKASVRLGVSELTIRVFGAVEGAGVGFLKDGRPKILFERHRMYRYLSEKYGESFAKQKMQQYPHIVNTASGGYQGGTAEYIRLELAKSIDQECALMSASWGQFQIMGENWKNLGYESVQQFVDEQFESESKQLDAFIRFIEWKSGTIAGKKVKLIDALKKEDWHAVFTLYNGANYKKLGYQAKFQKHFDRLESIYSMNT